jgi:hypothetical protein
MRCNLCGSLDAQIRPIELPTARITGKAHVDCNGHGQYRPVSREEIKEATNKEARICNAIPEMLELLSILSQSYDDSKSSHDLASTLYDLHCMALRLRDKIEGGGE